MSTARAARRARWSLIVVATVGAALYVGLPQVAGLDATWGRLSKGDPWWLGAAVLFELASYAGYVAFFRGVFAGAESRIGWRGSYDITMAGVAATRLLATAGVGGIALTSWALSRSGMARRELVSGLTTFYVALYGVFMIALVLVGSGLRTGILPCSAPFGVTVVPAAFGGAVIAVALGIARPRLTPAMIGPAYVPFAARRCRVTRADGGTSLNGRVVARVDLALPLSASAITV